MTLYCYLEDRFNSKASYNEFFNFHGKYVRLEVMKEFVKQKRAICNISATKTDIHEIQHRGLSAPKLEFPRKPYLLEQNRWYSANCTGQISYPKSTLHTSTGRKSSVEHTSKFFSSDLA